MPAIIFPIISGISNLMKLPALASFLGVLFAKVVALFAKRFTIGTAIQLGAIASIVGLTLALLSGLYSIMAGVSVFLPPSYSHAMSLIIPTNFVPCVTAVFSAKVVRWVWEWQVYFIQQVASAS